MNNTNKAVQYGVSPDYKLLYYKMKARGAQDTLNGIYAGVAMALLGFVMTLCCR